MVRCREQSLGILAIGSELPKRSATPTWLISLRATRAKAARCSRANSTSSLWLAVRSGRRLRAAVATTFIQRWVARRPTQPCHWRTTSVTSCARGAARCGASGWRGRADGARTSASACASSALMPRMLSSPLFVVTTMRGSVNSCSLRGGRAGCSAAPRKVASAHPAISLSTCSTVSGSADSAIPCQWSRRSSKASHMPLCTIRPSPPARRSRLRADSAFARCAHTSRPGAQ